ncbi:Hypothetical protein SRAE_X000218400 [Strongyloides ratti]|uniref:Uncharacterized protein n=1 Tax=Strongyloides ratti TaxID=34506 RepID=A0A090KSR2_STRRB|nr:Hypothetical protein SRAE_X000218400 [Strongyloides ratti]CEF60446.1 Hypothetical protein SRAE_X000218400 [Strongyloides ratti]
MGVYENNINACNEINAKQLLMKLDEKIDKIFNSKLNVKNIIKAITECVIPTYTYIFSHEFSDEDRSQLARNVDIRIRSYMNTKDMKLSSISNARCYLPRKQLGLGLRSTEVEMDKDTIKNFIHIIFSPYLKFAITHDANHRNKWRIKAMITANKYGINLQTNSENIKIIINNKEYNSFNLKEVKYKIKELVNEFSDKSWEAHYKKRKHFLK